ncbi:MAG: hypothetical protein WAK60_00330, partial [Sedimentisphaerales bacterium]
MAGFKTSRVLCFVASLLFVPLGISKGSIYLTVNSQNISEVTLTRGQSCSIEIMSNNTSEYVAHIGFQVPDILGPFEYATTMPQAGEFATVIPYNGAPFTNAFEVMATGGPVPGVHFVFHYTAAEVGQVTLYLCSPSGHLLDSLLITVTPPPPVVGVCCNPAGNSCDIMKQTECMFVWLGPDGDCNQCLPQGACCDHGSGMCSISRQYDCMYSWLGPDTDCSACQQPPPPPPPPPSVALQRFEINQCFQKVDGIADQNYALIETKPFDVNVTLSATENKTVKVELEVLGVKTDYNEIDVEAGKANTLHFLFDYNDTKGMKAGGYNFFLTVKEINDAVLISWSNTYAFKSSKIVRILVAKIQFDFANDFEPVNWNDRYLTFAEQV